MNYHAKPLQQVTVDIKITKRYETSIGLEAPPGYVKRPADREATRLWVQQYTNQ